MVFYDNEIEMTITYSELIVMYDKERELFSGF